VVVPWGQLKNGLKEEVFYFGQGNKLPNLNGRRANMVRRVSKVYYSGTRGKWPGFSQSDNYAVRWSGILVIQQSGLYKFKLLSDDGSKLFINDKLVVAHDGIHKMDKMSPVKAVKLTKFQQQLRLYFFERRGEGGMMLWYHGPDTGNVWRTPSGSALRSRLENGFKEEVYHMSGLSAVPQFGANAAMVRVIPQVVYANTNNKWPGYARSDNFAVRWTGLCQISRGGNYKFQLESDDGSKFWIGKKLVVNNDGLHGMRKREAYSRTTAKRYKFTLAFFERGGHAGMIFKYMGGDTRHRMVHVPQRRVTAGGVEESEPIR